MSRRIEREREREGGRKRVGEKKREVDNQIMIERERWRERWTQ